MKLGFIKSNFIDEKRVPLLPQDIHDFQNEIFIESGLGEYLNIKDQEYVDKGATILSRTKVFETCESIFSLKRIQPSDYQYIKKGQTIVGWTHPDGSGEPFMKEQAIPKNLIVVDLDNEVPTVSYKEKKYYPNWLPQNFIYQNSFYAGYAGTIHALLSYGLLPTNKNKIAVLGSGNVSQGAYHAVSKFSDNVRMFYRRTLPQFNDQIENFDIIINGIEVGNNGAPIISLKDQNKLKDNCFIIDVAADVGNTIEGTKFTSIDNPIRYEKGHYFYAVPNVPSIVYRNTSEVISRQFSKYVYSNDISKFVDLVNS